MTDATKSIIQDNFLFGSGFSLDLDFTCMIRNFPGQTEHYENAHNQKKDITFDVIIFDENGRNVYSKQSYAAVPYHSFYELKSEDLKFDFDLSKEYLINIRCNRDKTDHESSSKEGAVFYTNRKDRTKTCSVLYDALPHIPNKTSYNPITLLGHKCWVSSEIDCYVYFCNLNTSINNSSVNPEPLLLNIVSELGEIIYQHKESIFFNSIFKFDVKKHLPKEINLNKDLKFFNVIASASNSQYPIYTLFKNSVTGNLAIEHSLPPYYYIPQASDMKKVRTDFIKNFTKNEI